MSLKIEILTTVVTAAMLKEQADANDGVIDLGTWTKGWHDEWMWTPEYWQMQGLCPKCTSNTPRLGYGNSGYATLDDMARHLLDNLLDMRGMVKPFEEADTDAYASMRDDGDLYIFEFRVIAAD